MFSSASVCMFACLLLAVLRKTTESNFTKFGGKVTHVPQRKPLDLGGNSVNVIVALGLGLVRLGQVIPHVTVTFC